MKPSSTAAPKCKQYITGIGSRETPDPILLLLEEIGCWIANQGFVGRSGRAPGADQAFERGILRSQNPTALESFLPWASFEAPQPGDPACYHDVSKWENAVEAQAIAQAVIPWWDNLKQGARSLHGRNPYQVLGRDLQTPSSAVVYYTKVGKGGILKGGTRTAAVIAHQHQVPGFNLYYPFVQDLFTRIINT